MGIHWLFSSCLKIVTTKRKPSYQSYKIKSSRLTDDETEAHGGYGTCQNSHLVIGRPGPQICIYLTPNPICLPTIQGRFLKSMLCSHLLEWQKGSLKPASVLLEFTI